MRRRRLAIVCAGVAIVAAAAFLRAQQQVHTPAALEEWCSPLPVLYLQVRDAAGLIERYRSGAEERSYHESTNFTQFQQSKLYNKLEARIKRIEEVAGFGITLDNLVSFLGKESAVWLFDIQELKFVAATTIPEHRFADSALAQVKAQFEERQGDGFTYSVKEAPEEGVSLAFCRFGATLVFSNDLDSFLSVARRIRQKPDFFAEAQRAFRAAFDPEFTCGQATLFLTKEAIRNTYFRTYWVFRNAPSLAWIDRGLVDFREENNTWVERRYFSPETGGSVPCGPARDLGGIAGLFPSDPYYLKLSADSDPASISREVCRALLPGASTVNPEDFSVLLAPARPSASAIFLEGSFREGIFLSWDRVVAVQADDPASLDMEKLKAVCAGWVRTRLAIGTKAQAAITEAQTVVNGTPVWYLEVPAVSDRGVAICLSGKYLLFSTSRQALERILEKKNACSVPSSCSVFVTADVDRIRADCLKVVGLLTAGPGWQNEETPLFFSGNLPSLASWFSSVNRYTFSRAAAPGIVCETVWYLRSQ